MNARPLIWIDLENTPHVPFFLPIILELERRRCEIILTARDFAQTRALIEAAGLNARFFGGEYGNHALRKASGLIGRAAQLAWYLKGRKIALAVGHGSRGLAIAAKLLGIPSLTLYDYEGANIGVFNKLSRWIMTPELIPFESLEAFGLSKRQHLTYPGLKEEVYIADFNPSESFPTELALDERKVVITVRPPSDTAHYRSETSRDLFAQVMKLIAMRPDTQIILLPRNRSQRLSLRSEWIMHPHVTIPERAVNGLDLLYHSDLVIGGGGTMNREAAVLHVPVVSIFKGPEGAVDRSLVALGLMREISHAEEILPLLVKRERHSVPPVSTKVRDAIVEVIYNLSLRKPG